MCRVECPGDFLKETIVSTKRCVAASSRQMNRQKHKDTRARNPCLCRRRCARFIIRRLCDRLRTRVVTPCPYSPSLSPDRSFFFFGGGRKKFVTLTLSPGGVAAADRSGNTVDRRRSGCEKKTGPRTKKSRNEANYEPATLPIRLINVPPASRADDFTTRIPVPADSVSPCPPFHVIHSNIWSVTPRNSEKKTPSPFFEHRFGLHILPSSKYTTLRAVYKTTQTVL